MARYTEDQRDVLRLFAGSLGDLLPQDSVARAIWAGLERLDFSAFDAVYKNDDVGRPAVDPRHLTAVWTLGLLRGVTSSVPLASLCARDVEFRWLIGDAAVEKSTLCDFRKHHKEALLSLSAQVLAALGQHGLLPGENMGVDGTVVRAASSRHSVKSRRRLTRRKQHLEEILREKLSREEEEGNSEEVQALLKHQRLLEQALEEMTSEGLMKETDRMTVTEPEAGIKRQKDGSYAPGHNAQVVADLDTGAIIHARIVSSGNDSGQLQPQVEGAQAVLEGLGRGEGGRIQRVAADGAYHDTLQLESLEQQGIACYVPEDRNANRQAPGVSEQYQANAFEYDETTNTFVCPQGQRLKWRKVNNEKTSDVYQASTQACRHCPAKSECCPKSKEGRCVNRSLYKETLEKVAKRLETDEGHTRRWGRWVVCEGVFARLNGLLHWRRCRMWGRTGAEAELLWRQFAHNLMLLTGVWKPLVFAEDSTG